MSRASRLFGVLVAALMLSAAAGCTNQGSPPVKVAAADGPELSGAWYQIYFGSGSSEINARGRMIVKNIAYVVANNGATRVTVIGRTDRVGAPPANMALSERRAGAVRDALIGAGVPAERIDTSWTGDVNQAVTTASQVDEPRNRVVDVTVVKQEP